MWRAAAGCQEDSAKEVLLAHLKPVGKSRKARPTYKLTIGKDAWLESIDSLVFPLDVVFDKKSATYTLQTALRDIHDRGRRRSHKESYSKKKGNEFKINLRQISK